MKSSHLNRIVTGIVVNTERALEIVFFPFFMKMMLSLLVPYTLKRPNIRLLPMLSARDKAALSVYQANMSTPAISTPVHTTWHSPPPASG